jgi:hypothetical protein
MFHYIPRRPRGRYERLIDPKYDPARPTLDARRLEAWALTVGVRLADEYRPRAHRRDRAFLPDVDFSQIATKPAPAWRRLLSRLFR